MARFLIGSPLISLPHAAIGTHSMLQILRGLAADRQRLSDAALFSQQAPRLLAALSELRRQLKAKKHRQLLQKEPQLMKQLSQLTAVSLEHLSTQLDNADVCQMVTVGADTLGWLCQLVNERRRCSCLSLNP